MTQKPSIIAVTGIIGSGKTAAGKIFTALGTTVIDADTLARQALAPGTVALKKVVEHFGTIVLTPNNELDRKKLGALVFGNPKKVALLNSIVHPEVKKIFNAFILQEQLKNTTAPSAIDSKHKNVKAPIVYLVPLLFEANSSLDIYDAIIVISVSEEIAINRVMSRDNYSRLDVANRLSHQMSNKEKCSRATHIITNEGSLEELEEKLTTFYRNWLGSKS
jgi:dephospho-CoA kinase